MKLTINQAFLDRPENISNDDKLLQRISKSYRYAKSEQLKAKSCYQVGNEWLPIYEKYMGSIIQALTHQDMPELKRQYRNFFREQLSTGLHGLHFEMVEKYMTPSRGIAKADLETYVNCIMHNFNMFLKGSPQFDISRLVRKSIGNPYGFEVDNNFIDFGSEYQYHYSRQIKNLLIGTQNPVVLELGGGYGGMAYYLLRDFPQATYIGYDLPENAALQAYYLLSAFPEKNIILSGEVDLLGLNTQNVDAMILSNFEMETLQENSVDYSFNSYSLAEMEFDAIENYLKIICKSTRKYINHLNHSVFAKLSADDFPIDLKKFELIFRFPMMWGKFSGRNPTIDEHEYIYRNIN
jgi:putative sugar O-methyltransferase